MNHRLPPRLPGGFLARLKRDQRGNALAFMAAMLIPLMAFVGSAVDAARLYTVKTRLQQACDAGVLAGRKSMTDNTLDTSSTGQAQTFFNNNFQAGWFRTANVTFSPSLTADYQVQGTAKSDVPMTIMAIFGQPTRTLTVNCQARYDVADADIMFVLDTTGSMACTTADDNGNGCNAAVTSAQRADGTTFYYDVEETGSKISGLRTAILSFYDTLATSVDSSTHIRYGFVPYTSTVNVGDAITSVSPNYMVSKWQYQSRALVGDANNGNSSSTNYPNLDKTTCTTSATYNGRFPATGYNTDGSAVRKTGTWPSNVCVVVSQPLKPLWNYAQLPFDVSQYVATLNTSNKILDPTKVDGTQTKWQGCIEERPTVVSMSFDPNNLPPDLNPDLMPAASVDGTGMPTSSDTRWRPMWPDLIYFRQNTNAYVDNNSNSSNPYGDNNNLPNMNAVQLQQSGYVTCGKPAQRLKPLTRDQVSTYVNASDFKPIGGTYHDTGMIWGTRMLSQFGPFQADTAPWPGRQAPNRYIVFMTDGQMSTNQYIYGLWGFEALDQRTTGGDFNNSDNYHNARFLAECQAAQKHGITVFVVGFGQTLNSQLTSCASPGGAYYASDNAGLKAAFQKIAAQVAMLRISK